MKNRVKYHLVSCSSAQKPEIMNLMAHRKKKLHFILSQGPGLINTNRVKRRKNNNNSNKQDNCLESP